MTLAERCHLLTCYQLLVNQRLGNGKVSIAFSLGQLGVAANTIGKTQGVAEGHLRSDRVFASTNGKREEVHNQK